MNRQGAKSAKTGQGEGKGEEGGPGQGRGGRQAARRLAFFLSSRLGALGAWAVRCPRQAARAVTPSWRASVTAVRMRVNGSDRSRALSRRSSRARAAPASAGKRG